MLFNVSRSASLIYEIKNKHLMTKIYLILLIILYNITSIKINYYSLFNKLVKYPIGPQRLKRSELVPNVSKPCTIDLLHVSVNFVYVTNKLMT
jgi:hypothetical protein